VDDLTVVSHIGITVPDVAEACAELGTILGFTWAPIAEQVVATRSGDGDRETPVTLTWSRQGPPYLELLAAAEGTPWASDGTSRLHHVAYWVDDVPVACARLAASGAELELAGVDAGGASPARFAYFLRAGLRFEVLDRRQERMLERWLAG
jgi:catechol 2,3-dioxygenase-like lactoylglutathione lyase family enzyme